MHRLLPIHQSSDFCGSVGDGAKDEVTLTVAGIARILSNANRKTPRKTDFALHRGRNRVERFFNKLKQYRGVATRFDKLAETFLAGVLLICELISLN